MHVSKNDIFCMYIALQSAINSVLLKHKSHRSFVFKYSLTVETELTATSLYALCFSFQNATPLALLASDRKIAENPSRNHTPSKDANCHLLRTEDIEQEHSMDGHSGRHHPINYNIHLHGDRLHQKRNSFLL